jgi:O-antigen/teichoic acid export membrane protein
MAGINALISISNIDSGLYDRQVDGIRALISIANEVTTATTSREVISSPTGEIRKQSRLSVISKLRKDEMTWNSLFLILNTGLMAGTGFLFWIVAAHLFYTPDDPRKGAGYIGEGGLLISAAGLIAGLALLGLNMGMSRFLPTARNRNALISSSLVVVGVVGALGSLIYVLLTPVTVPELAFVGKNPLLALGFAVAGGAIAVNTLTDNIFIALRKAKYTVLVDGVIGGFGKLALLFVVVGTGAYGIFLASSLALVLAAGASLILIFVAMRVRVDLRSPLKALKPLLRFSGANYTASIINTMVGLASSAIVIDRLGATSAGYYFVVLQMTQVVYTAGLALEQTFLTEGSQVGADIAQLKRRALRLLVLFFVASATIMIGAGRWILLAFHPDYAEHGYPILVILVLAAGPLSINFWFQTILRLAGKLRAIVVVNATGAVLSCVGVWFGTSFGLTGVACGSVAAALIEVVIAAVAARERRS